MEIEEINILKSQVIKMMTCQKNQNDQHTNPVAGQNVRLPKATAETIAREVGVSESTVKRAEKFSKGINALKRKGQPP
ncbi:MAG: hypothetical protein ACI4TK_04830 [Agathobacter sp.]